MSNFIVKVDSLGDHGCDFTVIKCIDPRFRKPDQQFIENGLGIEHFALYSWPGAAKNILKNKNFREELLNNLKSVSIDLHNIKKLLLLWHWDCGAYGGSKKFSSDDEEETLYRDDMQTVKSRLVEELPAYIEIIMAYSKKTKQGLEYIIV